MKVAHQVKEAPVHEGDPMGRNAMDTTAWAID